MMMVLDVNMMLSVELPWSSIDGIEAEDLEKNTEYAMEDQLIGNNSYKSHTSVMRIAMAIVIEIGSAKTLFCTYSMS